MEKPDLEEKQIVLLEILAVSAIFSIAAIVLYIVFHYRPS